MTEWADVQLPPEAAIDRGTLKARALFYVPKALSLRPNGQDLVVSNVCAIASLAGANERQKPQAERRDVIGTSALRKVLKCHPVRYDSALQFIDFVNIDLLPNSGTNALTTRDIVACVFRPINLLRIVVELKTTLEEVSRETKVDYRIVRTMGGDQNRYQLADLIDVRNFLADRAKAQNKTVDQLTDRVEDFITTFCKPSANASIAANSEGQYIYSTHNLRRAPERGHPWAIEPAAR